MDRKKTETKKSITPTPGLEPGSSTSGPRKQLGSSHLPTELPGTSRELHENVSLKYRPYAPLPHLSMRAYIVSHVYHAAQRNAHIRYNKRKQMASPAGADRPPPPPTQEVASNPMRKANTPFLIMICYLLMKELMDSSLMRQSTSNYWPPCEIGVRCKCMPRTSINNKIKIKWKRCLGSALARRDSCRGRAQTLVGAKSNYCLTWWNRRD
jgi:hypothetical protein